MEDKELEFIPTLLPGIFARFDGNNDGNISTEEAFKLYETLTKTKLGRDAKRQVLPGSFREVVDAFKAESPYSPSHPSKQILKIAPTWSTQYMCDIISHMLQRDYSDLYGPYPGEKRESWPLIKR